MTFQHDLSRIKHQVEHHLGGRLQLIIRNVALLTEEGGPLTPRQKRYVENIRLSAERLAVIVNQERSAGGGSH